MAKPSKRDRNPIKLGYVIWWSPVDKVYFVRHEALPGISAFGDTKEQALDEYAIAVEAAREVYAAEGWDFPL